jgi:UDPglucose 6-dehydrogenase
MRVTFLGSGYVGIVSGACLADLGHVVTCVDTDKAKIRSLKRGRVPIFEPGLEKLVERNLQAKRLAFTANAGTAIQNADVVFITVGTPASRRGGLADLSFVYEAARTIAAHMRGFTVVATKSTVPLGTSEDVETIIREQRPDADFAVVSNPEFLREGCAIKDFQQPDRVVVGTDDERARQLMQELYDEVERSGTPILFTRRRTAELIKYAANAFLAVKIAFAGEIADLCEKADADIQEVARGIGLDRRIGPKFLQPGPGYGGSCFPKDTVALLATAKQHRSPMRIVETVAEVNQSRKRAMVDKVVDACGGTVRSKKIAVLGLTFKPNTDDMREAASLVIIPALEDLGAEIHAYDPAGLDSACKLMPTMHPAEDPYSCVKNADCVVILTEWDQFRKLDFDRIKQTLRGNVVVDLRNIYDPAQMARAGFTYVSIGRARIQGAMADVLAEPEKKPTRRREAAVTMAETTAL